MSWQALCGVDDPPFKGSPPALASAAGSMQRIADELQNQATLLQGYMNDTGSWTGAAKDACVKTVSGLPGQLRSAHQKYQSASSALSPYAVTLQDAQAKAESLRGQADDAQHKIDMYSRALHDQKVWEHTEQVRAQNAQTDPVTYGSAIVQPWHGPNNHVLLDNAKGDLASLRSQLDQLRSHVAAAVGTARNALNAAADIVHDDGGLIGFLKHSAVNIERAARWVVNEAAAHGLDLAALSSTLGALSGWLSIVGMIPIPGFQIFAAAGMVIGLVGVGIGLVTVLAGQQSLKSWAPGAALSLLPFAAKGLKAVALAKSAHSAGEASTVAENLKSSGSLSSTLRNSYKLVDGAEDFKTAASSNVAAKFLRLEPNLQPFDNLKLDNLGTKLLTGNSAANTATKIISMTRTGVVGNVAGVVDFADKANDFRERARTVVDTFNTLTNHDVPAVAS